MLSAPPTTTPAAPTGLADPAAWPIRLAAPDTLVRLAIVGLAAFLRLFWLDQRPPHFDEGVNGWFTDQMQATGFYKYDPSNYHGPLHFYVLFLFKCLFGRNLWALRLPVAFVGILTVDWMFRFRDFFGRRACAWAALAMALSPGTVYFHRDAIHETWLVFFLVLAFWGICGLWQLGGKRHLWAVAMGVTGAVLTKETYLIHFACFLAAVPVLWLLEDALPSTRRPLLGAPYPMPGPDEGAKSLWAVDAVSPPREIDRFFATCAPQRYRPAEVWTAIGVGLGLLVFFYSGNFFNWEGLGGLASTFAFWGKKAHEGEGHNKPFVYWLALVLRYEPAATLGLLACLRYLVPPLSTTRYRAFGAAGLALCLAVVVFEFAPGAALDQARDALAAVETRLLDDKAFLAEWAIGAVTTVFLAGAVSCLALPVLGDWRLRLVAICAPGTLVAYSLIPYKTPWCAISFLWPFYFTAAAGVVELTAALRSALRVAGYALAGVVLSISSWRMVDLNYLRPTDDHLGYVYVQTYNDVWRITEPLLDLAREDPSQYTGLRGVILCGSAYPLPWLLGDFDVKAIGYYADNNSPPEYRADFLLVQDSRVAEAESHLDDEYFKETVHLRPAQSILTLYLRASVFGHYFSRVAPGREPEFQPADAPVPTETLPPDEPSPTPPAD